MQSACVNHHGRPCEQLSGSESTEHEPLPADFEANLDEVAAPRPVYGRSEQPVRRQGYHLEDRSSESIHDPHQLRLRERTTNSESPPDPELQGDGVVFKEKSPTSPTRGHVFEFLRTAYIVSYLIIFSFIGTLLRLVIESITFYPGTPVTTSVLWANVGGSMIMGFLSEDQELFRFEEVESTIPQSERDNRAQRAAHLVAHKKTVPLYIGLTTGFCGSLTSFSTFARDVFLALSNNMPVPAGSYPGVSLFAPSAVGSKAPNGGFSFMALIAVLYTEIGLSLIGLFLGAHMAICVSPWTPSLAQRWLRKLLDPLTVILACLSWITVICLVVLLPHSEKGIALWSPETWRGPALFSLVFAPVGTLARFFLALKLNSRIASFPLGTFVANVGGTMVLGMAFSLQHAPIVSSRLGGGRAIGCQVLQGIMDGFCGSLTTVSTWVLELADLRRKHAYIYGSLSAAVGVCALIIEIGSLQWTRGLTTPACFAQ